MDDEKTIVVRRPRLWRQTPVTWILILVNVVWFVVVEGFRGLSIQGIVQSGALDWPDVVSGGQWWRLFTAMFVHFGLVHIGLNMVSLGSLYVVEWLLGSPMFLTTYLLSGLVGNLAILVFAAHDVTSAGASGAIFGIFGVALYMSFKGILTKAARNQLLIILVINLAYGFSSSDIGNSAHIGGLIAGVILAAWFVVKPQLRYAKAVRYLSYGLSILTVVALILALPGHSPALGI
ncbi:rhomboid family intramembrane serine protease [Alicyclobacillus mengziensis]|uniref:Rhomboid family intramembrane serine protease n=1 Tax=Alicyclobacillus mengziensis TaxID=2931921 RepID=A0A9X7VWH1_9BACL|nr:rhomboid family intramembrane serine protease [Alicyclobacillus mengziensis]QSO46363.1 rhomboid family intramembrane serine protease [Alicyclobacillus mengziensis]